MGFPEARKTAKDINTNTNKCSAQLEELLSSLNEKLNLMNSLISSISGGYVSKDYVDGGDAALRGELDALLAKFDNKRYVGSDNSIAAMTVDDPIISRNQSATASSFTAKYNGVVRGIIDCYSEHSLQADTDDNFYIKVYTKSGSTENTIATFKLSVAMGSQKLSFDFGVTAGETYYIHMHNTWGPGSEAAFISLNSVFIGADIVMG
jgi:hypothetical protein